jgi:signal transduction histidine kinase
MNSTPSVAYGTLADAALPGAAFNPDDFDVELSQTSLAEADELLKSTIDEAMSAVGGNRAFLALVDTVSGELVLRFTAGPGWTDDIRRLRVNMHAFVGQGEEAPSAATEAARRAVTGMRQGITRHVVVNGRRYWTGDVSRDPYYIGFFEDVKSEVAVPITARGGGTIGVVNVESPDPDAFNEEHANVLSVLARRVAVIVAMAEHQLREEALIAIGKDLNSTADVEVLMQDVVQQATKILRADDCSLFLYNEESEMLQLEASHGPLGEQAGLSGARYALGEGLTGWVAQHGEVIRVGDPRTDPRWKGLFMEAPAGELASVMAVPVRLHRGILGVLRVVRHRKGSLYFLPQEFTQADEDVFVTLAGQLAVAVDRTRLLGRLLHSERMAAWGEMSARSAHMIGNAVFGVKGHLNELNHWFEQYQRENRVDEADDDPKRARFDDARDLLESVTRGIFRLEGILGEFRDFVLATQLHATPHDVNQILRNVTAESFPKHSNIDLVLNLAPSLPPVLADEAKIKRAFAELIENSIDFQPHGGMLTIRTSIAESDAIREMTRGQMLGKVLQVEFIDHGPGLTEQDRQRVFTPFYTRKAKGMGLGLSIVKGIIEAHHGVIREVGDVATVKGRSGGAHFVILLPAHDEKSGETIE